jgi:hypothetical protein
MAGLLPAMIMTAGVAHAPAGVQLLPPAQFPDTTVRFTAVPGCGGVDLMCGGSPQVQV